MGNDMADSSSRGVAERKRHSFLVDFGIRLVKEKPLGTVGAVIALLLLFTGIFADFLAPYGMNETWLGGYLTPPSAKFWLGTDDIGRDIFSRIIFGARISVIVGLAGPTLATIISLIIGVTSGYFGGKFDLIVQRFVDIWMSLPSLIVLIVLMIILGPSIQSIILAVGVTWGIIGSRIIRSAVIGIKENVYVAAAEAIGCSTTRILTRHILPNIMAPTIILLTVRVPAIIIAEATLSFLGFGIPPPFPSWGGMISGAGREYLYEAPWLATYPGLALALVVYSINMFGDAVRDLLDPRLRGSAGRYGTKAKKEAETKGRATTHQKDQS